MDRRSATLAVLRSSCKAVQGFPDGNASFHDRTLSSRLDFQLAPQLTNTRIHAPQPDAQRSGPVVTKLLQKFWRNSFAAIGNLEDRFSVHLRQLDGCRRASGMPMHIRKALLKNPEERQFRLRSDSPKIRIGFERCLNIAPLGKAIQIPRDSRF